MSEMSNKCIVCNKDLTAFMMKSRLRDGLVCRECLLKAGMGDLLINGGGQQYTSFDISQQISACQQVSETLQICSACGKDLSHSLIKGAFQGGFICRNCLLSVGLGDLMLSNKGLSFNSSDVVDCIKRARTFRKTKGVSPYLILDEVNTLFGIHLSIWEENCYRFYKYKELLSYELLENNESISIGGLGAAVAGGSLFGGAGAITGSILGRKTKGVCSSIKLRISIDNPLENTVFIDFLSTQASRKSYTYNKAIESAQKCISLLEIVKAQSHNHSTEQRAYSVADEILKYNNLLKEGIITEAEFETKKKQLLSL